MTNRFTDPPPGFVVLRESDLDPLYGQRERWVGRGVLDGQSIIRRGLRSRSAAVRALWFAYDDAVAVAGDEPLAVVNVADVDSIVAEALARKHAVHREIQADGPQMKNRYCVLLDDWTMMEASLISQIVEDAGSIRRASKIIDFPRSTLSARIRKYRAMGVWPT